MIILHRIAFQGRGEIASRRVTLQLNEEKLNQFIGGAMRQFGIPKKLLPIYQELVLDKWDNSMPPYASMIDDTSPEYRKAALQYNAKLALIKKGMESTVKGKKILKEMLKEITDTTRIPCPSFNVKELV